MLAAQRLVTTCSHLTFDHAMFQSAAIYSKVGMFKLELPSPDVEIVNGVRWGAIDAFPTPAYWLFQIFERRLTGGPPNYKLGRSLAEELGACILGGHGIPADVGIAAYKRLRSEGVFESNEAPNEQRILDMLSSPLDVEGRQIRYRFAGQKAKYLSGALGLISQAPSNSTGRVLRDWLVTLPGVGLKTASWIARNWKGADDVAILDIHILRFGQSIGLFDRALKVERDYLKLEELFLAFSAGMDTKPSELDAVIWHEMANSPLAVRELTRAAEPQSSPLRKMRRQVQDLNQLALV